MAFPPLFTQGQLEIAAGGTDKLLQLVDKTKSQQLSSVPCQAFLAEVQNATLGEVCAILQVAFNPADPTFQGASFVQQNAVTIGLYWTWHKSTGGIAVPPEVKDAREQAIATLKQARDGLQSLGTDVTPESNVGVTSVNLVTSSRRILRRNTGGFC